ncbi:hypothetical protein KCP73_15080 [Salmonella enterica subsp. enterica]|nr:hypothetical protein KCP73_15080 [Salmonella enterica subsp. enterica]
MRPFNWKKNHAQRESDLVLKRDGDPIHFGVVAYKKQIIPLILFSELEEIEKLQRFIKRWPPYRRQ